MSSNSENESFPSIRYWLKFKSEEAIKRIVERARAELPDYRKRDIDELTARVRLSYTNWCESVLKKDLSLARSNSEQVIRENAAHNLDLTQTSRTPWMLCEVALEILDEAGAKVDDQERANFAAQARQMTSNMVTFGQLRIASTIAQKAMDNLKP
jgi:hypothetical protein